MKLNKFIEKGTGYSENKVYTLFLNLLVTVNNIPIELEEYNKELNDRDKVELYRLNGPGIWDCIKYKTLIYYKGVN